MIQGAPAMRMAGARLFSLTGRRIIGTIYEQAVQIMNQWKGFAMTAPPPIRTMTLRFCGPFAVHDFTCPGDALARVPAISA
ncbi:hypothetical protein METH_22370 (plasmid) [Leisingera methylohalidivorans DSM 14336]|uniref:Uncharacterized protein n=1 Tax=Leisingera methylohalidivorans DSM 14336 TaxID=999552 RepID=V9VXV8_9RHOB|nr:hypothetical protein METH_22370 [Leisingera methylohalidivorans DSM 14336]